MKPGKFRIYYKPVTIALVSIIAVVSILFFRNASIRPNPYDGFNLLEQDGPWYYVGEHINVWYYLGRIPAVNGRIADRIKNYHEIPWKSASELKSWQLKLKDEIWYVESIPDDYESLTLLIIPKYILGIEVYLDDQCIFTYGSFKIGPRKRENRINNQPFIVPLFDDLKKFGSKLPNLFVRLHYDEFPLELPLCDLYMDSLDTVALIVAFRFLGYKFWESSMGTLFLFLSGISFGIFVFQWKSRDYLSLTFGFFLLCAGIHYAHWRIAIVFGLTDMWGLYRLSTMLLPLCILILVGQLVASSYRRMVKRMCIFHIVFVVFFNISYFWLSSSPIGIYSLVYNSTLGVYLSVCFYILFKSRSQEYAVPLIIAFSVLCFVGFIDCLRWTIWLCIFNIAPPGYYYGIGVLVLICTFGYIVIDKYRKSQKRAQDYALDLEIKERKLLLLKSENLQARFDVLKNQVNPHFLFNTFGALISLIKKNKTDAVQFVEELSRVYRHLLQTQDQNLVTLRSELEFMASYSYLMKKRFGRRVQISNSVAECYLDYFVPPMSLQLLIENALKHNVISHKQPLAISIEGHSGDSDSLIVKNNYNKKAVLEKPTKVGLANLKQRYALLTQRKIEIISDAMNFLVKIPLLRENELEVG